MKSSLAVLGFFTAGCWLGTRPELPEFLRGGLLPLAALYLLMLEVGVSLGSDAKLKEILRSVKLRWLLLPAGTAAGTLLGAQAALAGFGAVLYRSGRRAAENEALKAGRKADEKVDKAIRRAGSLSRAELIERLRDREDI